MSKIVILNTKLGAPQLSRCLEEIRAAEPELANWIAGLNTVGIIKECVVLALDRLYGCDGINHGSKVVDYSGNAYKQKLDGIITTEELPGGIGVYVNDDGSIAFCADEYTSEWKDEIKRLQSLFADAFQAEIVKSVLQIRGYDVELGQISDNKGGFVYSIQAVKTNA